MGDLFGDGIDAKMLCFVVNEGFARTGFGGSEYKKWEKDQKI